MNYQDGITDIVAMYYQKYRNNKEWTENFFIKYSIPTTIMEEFYQMMIRKKEIRPIEELPEEEKNKFWLRVKDLDLEREKKIKLCHSYYVFEMIPALV